MTAFRKRVIIVTNLLLLILLTACTGIKFNGSRTGNEEQLIMDFSCFNTTDSQQLTLLKDDILEIQVSSLSGEINLKITEWQGAIIYEGKDIPTSEFELLIPEQGKYDVEVNGNKAKGAISIKKLEPINHSSES